MRLLNVQTQQLKTFDDDGQRPPFAILSHTWSSDDQEVTLQELDLIHNSKSNIVEILSKTGLAKITYCCELAKARHMEWAWIDTCCIDKTSSAELSEAINSMYRWYEQASLCFVHMVDVPDGENVSAESSSFRRSRWFRRGWTLQELIAPRTVIFFSRDWTELGTRSNLAPLIERICGVPADLYSHRDLSQYSIAQRMSWAADRQTTRKEDRAYSLLGLFGINLPLLYGEGEGAFQRLQQELLRLTNDQSIFAWGFLNLKLIDVSVKNDRRFESALARSPSDFEGCEEVIPCKLWEPDLEYTKKGVRIKLALVDDLMRLRVALLNCCLASNKTDLIAVPMIFPLKRDDFDWANTELLLGRQMNAVPSLLAGSWLASARITSGYLQVVNSSFRTTVAGHALESSIKISTTGVTLKVLASDDDLISFTDSAGDLHVYEENSPEPKRIFISCDAHRSQARFLVVIKIGNKQRIGIQPSTRTFVCELAAAEDYELIQSEEGKPGELRTNEYLFLQNTQVYVNRVKDAPLSVGMGHISFATRAHVGAIMQENRSSLLFMVYAALLFLILIGFIARLLFYILVGMQKATESFVGTVYRKDGQNRDPRVATSLQLLFTVLALYWIGPLPIRLWKIIYRELLKDHMAGYSLQVKYIKRT